MARPGGAGAVAPQGRTVRVTRQGRSGAGRQGRSRACRCSYRRANPASPARRSRRVRLTTDQLPATTVALSDANTMIEGRNLSSVDDVEVVARVAFGGTSRRRSGDLHRHAPCRRRAAREDLDVVISKVQP